MNSKNHKGFIHNFALLVLGVLVLGVVGFAGFKVVSNKESLEADAASYTMYDYDSTLANPTQSPMVPQELGYGTVSAYCKEQFIVKNKKQTRVRFVQVNRVPAPTNEVRMLSLSVRRTGKVISTAKVEVPFGAAKWSYVQVDEAAGDTVGLAMGTLNKGGGGDLDLSKVGNCTPSSNTNPLLGLRNFVGSDGRLYISWNAIGVSSCTGVDGLANKNVITGRANFVNPKFQKYTMTCKAAVGGKTISSTIIPDINAAPNTVSKVYGELRSPYAITSSTPQFYGCKTPVVNGDKTAFIVTIKAVRKTQDTLSASLSNNSINNGTSTKMLKDWKNNQGFIAVYGYAANTINLGYQTSKAGYGFGQYTVSSIVNCVKP